MKENLPPLPKLELGIYQHYKNPEMRYEVLGAARHSETLEPLVVYRALYGQKELWVRPYAMFTGTVVVEGKEVKRFVKVG